MFAGHVKAAWANLRASRFRTYLTMLGIIIGVSSVITIISLGEGLKHQVVGQVGNLSNSALTVRPGKLISGSGNKQNINLLAFLSTSTLSDNDVNALDKLPTAEKITPVNFVTSSAKSDNLGLDNISVIGSRPELAEYYNLTTKYGDFLTDQTKGAKVAVIGSDIASKFFTEINPIGNNITVSGQSFVVRAVLDKTSTGVFAAAQTNFNSAIIIPYDVSKDLSGGKTNILQILAQTKSGLDPDRVSRDIADQISKVHGNGDDFTVLKQKQLLSLVNNTVGNATNFLTAIAAISLLVAGIGIMDIMLASVAERTREIGIRKALGATNRQILNQFFAEGLVLSIGGGIIGVIVALAATQLLKFYTDLEPLINVYVIIAALLITVVIGVVFSIIPAIKAARKEPIDALRG